MGRTDSMEKTLILGKIEGRRRRGWQRMRWLDGITNSQNLPKLMSIESAVPSNHLILCPPLLRLCSIFPSIRVFSNESVLCIRLAKVLEFQLQHQSFQWTPRSDLLKDGLVGSPCNPWDSQESSSTPPIKRISSLALSFLCSPNSHIHTWLLEKP